MTDQTEVLGIILLWTLAAILAWVGVVRHVCRWYRAHQDLQAICRLETNGLLRWAAESYQMNEGLRVMVKAALLIFAVLRLSTALERSQDGLRVWDGRDVALPAVMVVVLLLLTHWSNWEMQHRPATPLEASQ